MKIKLLNIATIITGHVFRSKIEYMPNGNVNLLNMDSISTTGKVLLNASATKVNQLFQILLYEKKGIPRVDLWDALFDNEYISNPSNSLRALVFRLRKALIKAGLPDDEFVHISRGVYSFSSRFEIVCDAITFEECVESLSKISEINARIEKLLGLYEMYQGSFLPMITSSTWCTTINVRLRKPRYFLRN